MTTQGDKLPMTESLSGSSLDNISQLTNQPNHPDYPSTINVYSSDNVHVGPKNIYKGNVSITHIVLPDGKSVVSENGSEQVDKLPEKIINGDYIYQTHGQVFNISNGKIPSTSPLIRIITNDEKTSKLCQKRLMFFASIVVCTIILSTLIYFIKFGTLFKHKEESESFSGNYSKDENQDIYYHLVYRASWVAQPPTEPGSRLQHPVPEVEILHTATEFCFDHHYCSTVVRNIQDFQIGSGKFADIAYNFLISGNGYIYEGRGWDTVSASVQGRNFFIISIALIGTFTVTEPTDLQMKALERFIREGVQYGKIAANYSLHAHCQWSSTKSPGVKVVQKLEKMPHWNESCSQCCAE